MTTLEVLEAARDLIRDKDKWFGGDSDWNEDRHCALTACADAGGLYGRRIPDAAASGWAALREALELMGEMPYLMSFNDSHTHAEVLELFNIAIANELAKQREPKVRMATYNGHLEPVAA